MDQARLLQCLLKQFCDYTGQWVSTQKSNIFFSKGIDNGLGDQISTLLDFHEVQNLGTYLGVPLLHDRITKSTQNFMVDKVRRRLQNWSARNIFMAGRITLVQSILLAILNYFIQTKLIPKGICDKLERLAHQFFWALQKGTLSSLLWDELYLSAQIPCTSWASQIA